MINIPSYIQDPNYRYKMVKMVLKPEGKGNGVKTNITNLVQVASKLQTNPEYILKFFGIEMGAQTIYTEVGKNNISSIIKGKFSYEDFIKVLDKFIDKYICCHKCKYPEMHMYVKKSKLKGTCDACGFDGDLDSAHDIATFILKKPPKDSKTIQKPKGNELQIQENEPEIEKKGKKAKLAKEDIPMDGQKLEEILSGLQSYYKEVSGQEDDSQIVAAEMTNQIKNLGIQKTLTDRFGYLIFNTIFDESISKQIKASAEIYKQLIVKFTGDSRSLETIINLQCLYFLRSKNQEIQKYAPTILKLMSEFDIVTQEFISEWAQSRGPQELMKSHSQYNQERDNRFKQLVKPFTDWLLSADDEDDEQ